MVMAVTVTVLTIILVMMMTVMVGIWDGGVGDNSSTVHRGIELIFFLFCNEIAVHGCYASGLVMLVVDLRAILMVKAKVVIDSSQQFRGLWLE